MVERELARMLYFGAFVQIVVTYCKMPAQHLYKSVHKSLHSGFVSFLTRETPNEFGLA